MALTGMQIYKLLPKTNCKDCGLPTCMAFAMQVAAKQKALTDCPHVSEESKSELSEASSPPMKLVKIGSGDVTFEIGQETVMFNSKVPLIIVGKDAGKVKAAAEAIKDKRPLLYGADASNIDALSDVASSCKCPLAISAGSLEELADLTSKAKEKGVEDLILSFDTKDMVQTLRSLTIARRAALKKNFRPLGYPALVEVLEGDAIDETVVAAAFAAKYAGIVIIDNAEPWELLPIMVVVQNIYTDPQVPNTVDAKLYEIGDVTENSPVLFTTNFSLTYFSVEAEVERSKIPTYICVIETEGLGVLNAYAGDKISAELVVKTIQEQKVAEKVKHRKLIIPGLLPIFRAEIEDTSEWKEVIIGPETAREIPGFLTNGWK